MIFLLYNIIFCSFIFLDTQHFLSPVMTDSVDLSFPFAFDILVWNCWVHSDFQCLHLYSSSDNRKAIFMFF